MKFNEVICDWAKRWKCPAEHTHTWTEGQKPLCCMSLYCVMGKRQNLYLTGHLLEAASITYCMQIKNKPLSLRYIASKHNEHVFIHYWYVAESGLELVLWLKSWRCSGSTFVTGRRINSDNCDAVLLLAISPTVWKRSSNCCEII